ncbi:phosphatidate phosphatase PAH2-like isoform X2 [Andrographis paniculata]|uniref:phosphatidate phosphatase PAH2-like isoform X2 n=1 Tax=Andrographis paniculata TaxID=175694 RepID=UPI0021E70779|nr:phosphatidate phosphatase PAH2-like isoform X2 [Andrographis paniculata]
MQAVGKIGSYIGKSVYTVSGPFHPFGGAVDIIVVEQPDGTYKSSPWYVRFGKFQGVLKTKEKVVRIYVNGVEADFQMYLDHKGEAFFLKEVDVEEGDLACSPQSSSDDSSTGKGRNGNAGVLTRTDSRRARLLGLVFGRTSRKEAIVEEEDDNVFVRTESLERAEIAADLLELKWSTNLASSRLRKNNASSVSNVDVSKDEAKEISPADSCGCDGAGLIPDGNNHELERTVEENGIEVKCSNSDCLAEAVPLFVSNEEVSESTEAGLVQCIEQRSDSFHRRACEEACVCTELVQDISENSKTGRAVEHTQEELNIQQCLRYGDQLSFLHEKEMVSVTGGMMYGPSERNVSECFSQSVSVYQSQDSLEAVDSQSVAVTSASGVSTCSSVEHQNISGNLGAFDPNDDKHQMFIRAHHEQMEINPSVSSVVIDETNQCIEARCCSVSPLDQSVIDDYMNCDDSPRRCKSIPSDVSVNKTGHVRSKEFIRMVRSLPNMGPISKDLEASGLSHSSDTLSGAQTTVEAVEILNRSRKGPVNPLLGKSASSNATFGGSRRGWPFSFKRSRTARVSHIGVKGAGNPSKLIVPDGSVSLDEGNIEKLKLKKKILKTLTPTSEQLASLNLKEGKNTVVFTFSTSMLGNQQVDARIFLWRWDTRIVISDVDGTITRSDLLGQVMPLVGMDWSQTGVARLFSAIKENGYQLLFLSARSISQSFHTRQFLCNIRQDGKGLPEGPVVISPDGLFPSLYREVVRRTPHEFKIACLEDIKALFPADRNPFYAGFGNRDTDEFSYLKVGIPRGKIFTINPKGEIVVNRHVHTKSYLSLHSLVHGMFPTMSSSEQEDYNSWNYWKLPPPTVDL